MSHQCSLDGCAAKIEQSAEGPERKYCCPAHRVAARAARLKASGPARADPTIEPCLDERTDAEPPTPDAAAEGTSRPGVDGDAVDGGNSEPGLSSAGQRWAIEAQQALASIDRQLDDASAAERRWAAAAETVGPSPRQPLEFTVLVERRIALQRMRITLESQLAACRNLQDISAALTVARNQLSEVDMAARGPKMACGGDDSSRMLADQRGRLAAEMDLLHGQLRELRAHVEIAVLSAPGPSPADVTTPLVSQIDGLIG